MTKRSGADEGWSALMDDEVDDTELAQLLDESADADVRQRFQRYQISRAVMRGERLEAQAFTDLSARIRDALEQEGTELDQSDAANVIEFKSRDQRSKQKVFGEFWKSMGSIAIAASVAGVIVLGARYLDAPAGLGPDTLVAGSEVEAEVPGAPQPEILRASTASELEALAAGETRQTRFILRASDPRISDYQRRHLQFTAEAGGGGMMPFARVVSLESDQ